MNAADRVIRWSTALAVVGVAAVAAVAFYEHAYDLVQAHGEAGRTARLVPLTVSGLIYASSMVMLNSARRATPILALARWLLGLGIAATLAANVAPRRRRPRRTSPCPARDSGQLLVDFPLSDVERVTDSAAAFVISMRSCEGRQERTRHSYYGDKNYKITKCRMSQPASENSHVSRS